MILTRLNKLLLIGFLLISCVVVGSTVSDPMREFDEDAMSSYSESADFDYMNYKLKTASIWDMLKWWLMDVWTEFWRNPVTSRLTTYLFIAIMIGIAIFYVVKMKYGRVFAKSGNFKKNELIVPEDIHQVDYQSLLNKSLQDNDFKLAIRYLYLASLAELAKKGIIKLKDWKTPYDYGTEMPRGIAPHYLHLSNLFEYAWYGDFSVNRADFDKCRNLTEKIQEDLP